MQNKTSNQTSHIIFKFHSNPISGVKVELRPVPPHKHSPSSMSKLFVYASKLSQSNLIKHKKTRIRCIGGRTFQMIFLMPPPRKPSINIFYSFHFGFGTMPSLPFLIQNKIKYNLSFTYSLSLGDQSIMRVRLKEQKTVCQCHCNRASAIKI